jgi:ribosomal protein L22
MRDILSAILIFGIALLTGCGSFVKKDTPPAPVEERPAIVTPTASAGGLITGFTGTGIKLTYTDKGEWESITSTASAPTYLSTREAAEVAQTVAEMKARRAMAEFVKNEVNSKKVLTIYSKNARGDEEEDAHSQEIHDRITQTASSILRGTIVESAYVDASSLTVTVVVRADRKTLAFANGIKGGPL